MSFLQFPNVPEVKYAAGTDGRFNARITCYACGAKGHKTDKCCVRKDETGARLDRNEGRGNGNQAAVEGEVSRLRRTVIFNQLSETHIFQAGFFSTVSPRITYFVMKSW